MSVKQRITYAAAAIAFAALGLSAAALALPSVGTPAPQFTATTADGKPLNLKDFAGKPVVLEWTNRDCPFVKKHYSSGNMQAVQAAVAKAGGAWISIVSSAPGKQGHITPDEATKHVSVMKATVDGVVLDEKGDIGRLYGATATPQMFVLDGAQTLRYMGAIDDKPSAAPDSLKGANNYVLAAVDSIKTSKHLATTETAPYGCSVKY